MPLPVASRSARVPKDQHLGEALASVAPTALLAARLYPNMCTFTRQVQAARLQIAKGRQQLLASMVMLGINRIVVTDGLIHAKVIFDMRASDTAARTAKASMYDRQKQASMSRTSVSYSGWLSPVDASYTNENSSEHVATVQSAVEDTSESKAAVKAVRTAWISSRDR